MVAAFATRHIAKISRRGRAGCVRDSSFIRVRSRAEAAALGIRQFEMTSGLNDSPTFIAALADLVAGAIGVNLFSIGSDRDAGCTAAAD